MAGGGGGKGGLEGKRFPFPRFWTLAAALEAKLLSSVRLVDDDELMLNVLRCHLTY